MGEVLNETFFHRRHQVLCEGIRVPARGQLGNVLFTAGRSNQLALTRAIEDALSKTFAYRSRVVVRSFEQMKTIVDYSGCGRLLGKGRGEGGHPGQHLGAGTAGGARQAIVPPCRFTMSCVT